MLQTNPSIFLRLNRADAAGRELAWQEFRDRYAPVIAGLAQTLGARAQDVDDLIQDVLTGFYAASPRFAYDPSKGRFRAYLKACVCHALRQRAGQDAKFRGIPLHRLDPADLQTEHAWADLWEQQLLQRAVDQVRADTGNSLTFQAFERYVIHDEPAAQVAQSLGIHVDSVYRAKPEITDRLRQRLAAIRAEEG